MYLTFNDSLTLFQYCIALFKHHIALFRQRIALVPLVRYDVRRVQYGVGSDCSFNLVLTIAYFCEDVKQPCSNDLFIILLNTGAKDITHLLHKPCQYWINDAVFVWCSPKNFDYLIPYNLLKASKRRHFSVIDHTLLSIHICFSYAIHFGAEESSK